MLYSPLIARRAGARRPRMPVAARRRCRDSAPAVLRCGADPEAQATAEQHAPATAAIRRAGRVTAIPARVPVATQADEAWRDRVRVMAARPVGRAGARPMA